MDGLLYVNTAQRGNNLDATLYRGDGTVFNVATGQYEAFTPANYASYAIAFTEQGNSGVFFAAMPTGVAEAVHTIDIRVRSGGFAAVTDNQPTGYSTQQKFWDGNVLWSARSLVSTVGVHGLIGNP